MPKQWYPSSLLLLLRGHGQRVMIQNTSFRVQVLRRRVLRRNDMNPLGLDRGLQYPAMAPTFNLMQKLQTQGT
jgi:hypothetical protein